MIELWRNNYGRRKGKALRSAQKSYMSNLQKYLPVGMDIDENPSRKKVNIFSNSGGTEKCRSQAERMFLYIPPMVTEKLYKP